MLRISGEILTFINDTEFIDKQDLLQKLRNMRENLQYFEPSRRNTLKQMVGIAIQQVYRCSEKELNYYNDFKKLTLR